MPPFRRLSSRTRRRRPRAAASWAATSAKPATPTSGSTSIRTRISRASPQARSRPSAPDAKAATARRKAHVAARGGKTTIPRAFSLMTPESQMLDTCLALPRQQLRPRQHPPLGAHPERRGMHQLPLHSPFAHAQISAGEKAERTVLLMPRQYPRAIRYAVQASRQRRLHGVLGLPQSARHVRGHLGMGSARHGGRSRWQRRALPEMPRG